MRALLAIASVLPLVAHGPLAEQIATAGVEIGKDPGNARLYVKRGELYRLQREFPMAQADFDRAARIDPLAAEVDLARGRMWLDAGNPEKARTALDRFLARRPGDGAGRAARGEARARLDDARGAAIDYDAAVATPGFAQVELYLARARAWAAAGDSPRALAGLDEAIARLGSLVTLEDAAIELERKLGRWDSALARVDRVAEPLERKETWLARRGDILRQAGRTEEAQASYVLALRAIESLPVRLRRMPATQDLEARVRAALSTPDA
ncbi:MAG: tetratricopeptide repeat protein [Bryobacteraceae bacterium]